MFIADNLQQLVGYLSIREYILVIYPLISVLCFIRNLRTLAPVSTFGNISLLVGFALIIGYNVDTLHDKHEPLSLPAVGNPVAIPIFMGNVIYSFEVFASVT